MKKTLLIVMLLGVITSSGLAREKYKIMVRTDVDGKNWYYPMRKIHDGYIARTWVMVWPLPTEEEAKRRIDEWKMDAELTKQMNKKKYIYIN